MPGASAALEVRVAPALVLSVVIGSPLRLVRDHGPQRREHAARAGVDQIRHDPVDPLIGVGRLLEEQILILADDGAAERRPNASPPSKLRSLARAPGFSSTRCIAPFAIARVSASS
jgi:hypothetical protein